MNYKLTQQYLKTKEVLIARFVTLNDARLFIAKKQNIDDLERHSRSYRLYDEHELLQEFNRPGVCSSLPEDVEDYARVQLSFRVERLNSKISIRVALAEFKEEADASMLVECLCRAASYDEEASSYLIFKEAILVARLNKSLIAQRDLKNQQSAAEAVVMSLSPLATRPTPPGGPGDYWIDQADESE